MARDDVARKKGKLSAAERAARNEQVWTTELILVLVLLLALLGLVGLVWLAPMPEVASTNTTAAEVLDFRKNTLAILLTTFGAWVGAGAAYYFGKQNLRTATDSLLQMREVSPRERLHKTPVSEIPPRKLDWFVRETETVAEVLGKLEQSPAIWFIPIVNANNRLVTVINEEAVYRFVNERFRQQAPAAGATTYAQVVGSPMTAVLSYIDQLERTTRRGDKRFRDISVEITMNQTVGEANDRMEARGVSLAIISDDKGAPAHYLTTADVRAALLRMG